MFCCTNDRINDINQNTINQLIRYLKDDSGRKHQIIEDEENYSLNKNIELIDREYLKHFHKQSVQPSSLSYDYHHLKK